MDGRNKRMKLTNNKMELTVLPLCCGVGGQDLGFEQSRHEYKGIIGKFTTLGGIDNDPIAIRNFERVTGNKAYCIDLFTRQQYVMFHGQEPPSSWEELTPEKLRDLFPVRPDVVIMSPPCKGNSRLLPKQQAMTPKYVALNQLPERIYTLVLEAWFDDLPPILLMENVPGIKDKGRGQTYLKTINEKLTQYGYVSHEALYDCGEWGELGQHRVRYLHISRLPSKIPSFVFEPPSFPLKSIGDILGPLPMPGDVVKCGRLHRIPNLAWRTWERLALIPAGKDWRALETYSHSPHNGTYRIIPWDNPSTTLTAQSNPGNASAVQIADPRINKLGYGNKYRVTADDSPAPVVTGARIGSGGIVYADPKVPKFNVNRQRIGKWDSPSSAVIANAENFVADPRYRDHFHCFKVSPWNKPADTVTSGHSPTGGAVSVADPRLNKHKERFGNAYKVVKWDDAAPVITGQGEVQTGAISVADPRLNCRPWGNTKGPFGVQEWDKPSSTIFGAFDIHAGAAAVADPRMPDPNEKGVFIIIAADGTWHRPITTYEGAMLQGFPRTFRDGSPFDLVDCSDGKAREYIGNAVPVQTATAIGNTLLRSLMPCLLGDYYWGCSNDKVWVKPSYNDKYDFDDEYYDEEFGEIY
jgi:site-specific DNA-cytosine methylase